MYHYDMDSNQVKNIRLKKEINGLEEKSDYYVNSIVGNSKYYSGFTSNSNNNVENDTNVSSKSLRKNMDDLVNSKFPIQSIKFTLWFREKNGISWKNILTSFGIGICLFPILIGVTGWIVFLNHPSRDTAASLVTVISFILEMIVSYELYLSKDYLLDEPTTTTSSSNNNGGDDE